MIKLFVDGKLHSIETLQVAVAVSSYLQSFGWKVEDRRDNEDVIRLYSVPTAA